MRISLETAATLIGDKTQVKATTQHLREDFKNELERRLDGWLGKPGTETRSKIEEAVSEILSSPDENGVRHVDLDKLTEDKTRELVKLQKASQDFEAIFVKGLLSQMRRSSFAEKGGPMADLAKDFMDQAVSESVSRSDNSIGIAKTIFIDMAQRIAKGRTTTKPEEN